MSIRCRMKRSRLRSGWPSRSTNGRTSLRVRRTIPAKDARDVDTELRRHRSRHGEQGRTHEGHQRGDLR